MANDWKEYQEEAAEFFRSIGLKAETDVTLQGVRTKHDVDVYVQIDVAGFKVRWIVECKHWKSAVNKLHVMGLREIAADLGVDRGIILCESGFQSGAVEAAKLTNVQVTSLEALGKTSQEAIYAFQLQDLFDRTEKCRERYWDIPKSVRIKHGLRADTFSDDIYSGQFIVEVVSKVISKASRGIFPVESDLLDRTKVPCLPGLLCNYGEVVAVLEPLVAELESKLNTAAVSK